LQTPTLNDIPALLRRRRYWWALLLAWAAAVLLSLQDGLGDIRRYNLEVAAAGARNMFQMVWLARQWNASHTAVYVPVDENTQPNPYLQDPRRDVETLDGQKLTMINPAYMTRLIGEIAQQQSHVVFHITSLQPIRPANAPDEWERGALKAFEQGSREISGLLDNSNGRVFRYMAPLLTQQACLKCHGSQGYQLGDVRGGISVTQDFAPFEAAGAPSRRKAIGLHLGVFLLVAGLGWWALEQLRRRWLELAGKIGELKQTQEELLQNEKLASLGRMVAGFAHEINTPVGVAVGAVSHGEETVGELEALLERDEVEEAELRERLAILRESSALALSNLRRAAGLVQSFKRSAVDQISEETRRFELRPLLKDVLFSLHNTLKRLPLQIRLDCPEKLAIHGIPGLYDQLFTNLLLNSVQHGFEEGSRAGHLDIRVAVAAAGRLEIEVADDGVGMSPEAQQRAFEPFFTTRRARGGTGLGLYICYTIATARLGGTISCTSQPGQGTRIHLAIPAELA
jgi:signal transduction histidine kinase